MDKAKPKATRMEVARGRFIFLVEPFRQGTISGSAIPDAVTVRRYLGLGLPASGTSNPAGAGVSSS